MRLPYQHVWNTRDRVWAKSHQYDDELRQVIEHQLMSGRIGFDVGANRGEILAHMVAVAPQARHVAVEPIPELAAALRARYPQVLVINGALSNIPGRASFRVVRNSLEESSLRPTTTHIPHPDVELIQVSVSRLDDLESTADVGLIKLDTEGSEYWILQGATRTIERCRPVIVFEAGGNTTPNFDVTPEMFWEFFCARAYSITIMRRWLVGLPSFSAKEFLAASIRTPGLPRWWQRRKEWMFLAHSNK
jgi:FkbM family methyltransferase